MYREILLLPFLDQEKRFFALAKASITILQLVDCRFCFFIFSKKLAFLNDRLFVSAKKLFFIESSKVATKLL